MSEPRNKAQNHEPETHGNLPKDAPKPSRGKVIVLLIVVLVVAAVLAVTGIVPRLRARTQLQDDTNAAAPPDVLVEKPKMGKAQQQLLLPGALEAYVDAPVYARTSGYLRHWYFDIGAHVRKGQLLAVIESPEVDQQLVQARADLATAQANAGNAVIQANRYKDLLGQDAVSKQDTDNFVTQQTATSTQVRSAQANVQRLEQLVAFEQVTAPFDGVITARNIDQGQLINAGATTATPGSELFHVSQTGTLRVYINVPQIDSRAAKPGVKATLTLAEFPGRDFDGKIVRTSDSIDPNTRTLLVEVDVNNRDGRLMPGAYGEVHMKLANDAKTLVIPVPAMIFRSQGLQVALVDGNKAKLVPIVVGKDDGRIVEVTQGLTPDDEVIQDPPDSVIDGEVVHVIQPQKSGGAGGNGGGSAGGGGGKSSGSEGGKS
jgi:RND family efflux transporter MFP subunit